MKFQAYNTWVANCIKGKEEHSINYRTNKKYSPAEAALRYARARIAQTDANKNKMMDSYEKSLYQGAIERACGTEAYIKKMELLMQSFDSIDINRDLKITEKELATAMLIADMRDGEIDGKISPENCPELIGKVSTDSLPYRYSKEVMEANYPEESN